MEELGSVHRYAAGALLAIALNQAQIHRLQLVPDILGSDDGPSMSNTLEDQGVLPWSSQEFGLLHHIFGYLKIDPHAWPGIEKTAEAADAKHHIGPYIRILQEENLETASKSSASSGNSPSSTNSSSSTGKPEKTLAALAKAVDAMTISLEEYAASRPEPAHARAVEDATSSEEAYKQNDKRSSKPKSASAQKSAQRWASMKKPLLDRAASSSDLSHKDTKKKTDRASAYDASSSEPEDKEASERRILVAQRKVAVLYELLTACVADTPEEKAGKSVLNAGYDARQRVALRLLALWLDVDWKKVAAMELMVAYMAMEAEKVREEERAASHTDDEHKTTKWQKWKRGGIIGAAAVTGGALLALTGGLAAPAIAAGLTALAPAFAAVVPAVGIGGLATAVGSAAGSVAVAASFGAAGAGLAGTKMARRTGGVDEFMFLPIGDNHQQGRLAVGIVISGIAMEAEDYTLPWEGSDGELERYALRWESKELIALSTAIEDWLASSAARELVKAGAMMTVLAGLVAALAWPVALLSATDWIDSRWTIAVDRADKAGKILAKCLLGGSQGNRPVTLIGFSLGARVIFSCLEYLAKKGNDASIVERVVLLGAPLTLDRQRWENARKVVAGRFINAYSSNDWILGVVYRSSFMTTGLAGIQKVEIPGVENIDVSDIISGHSMYLAKTKEILAALDLDSFFPIYPSKLEGPLDPDSP
ncbi:hypothetical protein MPTK1_5g13000 [Marchantia polymorpha subsp. ruderalis]|nr:hypothetical protein MARPO_0092s0008 [Marchantia polymorpha]BBN11567.1 hypothetical protein Mp_5g13000 [Marchantia polymorpha subsp. ruderalis]|eukprot:PTQ33034.1 hypothetical protein MARPO_0092s0008 [Marchantia polymorpha]